MIARYAYRLLLLRVKTKPGLPAPAFFYTKANSGYTSRENITPLAKLTAITLPAKSGSVSSGIPVN